MRRASSSAMRCCRGSSIARIARRFSSSWDAILASGWAARAVWTTRRIGATGGEAAGAGAWSGSSASRRSFTTSAKATSTASRCRSASTVRIPIVSAMTATSTALRPVKKLRCASETISYAVFGSGHSTPMRIVESSAWT